MVRHDERGVSKQALERERVTAIAKKGDRKGVTEAVWMHVDYSCSFSESHGQLKQAIRRQRQAASSDEDILIIVTKQVLSQDDRCFHRVGDDALLLPFPHDDEQALFEQDIGLCDRAKLVRSKSAVHQQCKDR